MWWKRSHVFVDLPAQSSPVSHRHGRDDPPSPTSAAMLPPVEQSVLENNPEFAALYSKLTTSLLNPDGASKNDPAAKERRLVSEVGWRLVPERQNAPERHIIP